jgi:hypothetical protein
MSAVLVTLSSSDLFKSGGGSDHLISISGVNDIVGDSGLAIYNSVSVRLNETIQYFLTFDDVIKAIHFGKGVGSILAEGTMFSTCSGDVPGMSKFSSAFTNLRGKVTQATIGGMAFQVMVTDAQVQIIGDPDTMAMFSFSFAILDHNL